MLISLKNSEFNSYHYQSSIYQKHKNLQIMQKIDRIRAQLNFAGYFSDKFLMTNILFEVLFKITIIQNPPLSCKTMWIVDPAFRLQSDMVWSSFSCLPPKISLICSMAIPSFSCNACFTCKIYKILKFRYYGPLYEYLLYCLHRS